MIDLLLLTAIPLETFDQQKLEALLRKIPEAHAKTVEVTNGKRRIYSYPKSLRESFQFNCEADFLFDSEFPSYSKCSLNISQELSPKEDEHLIVVNNSELASSLYKAIPEGMELKKFYSTERVYGLKLNGKYGNHFRYSLVCSEQKCDLTVSTK